MRNDELYSPACADEHAKKLVRGYVLRGLVDERGAYSPEKLLVMQHEVYTEWLAAMRKSRSDFDCGFYEWLGRSGDQALVFRPGDLVKFRGLYCVVTRRPNDMEWVSSWRLHNGKPRKEAWPTPMATIEVKESNGHVYVLNALDGDLEPAGIPPEVFALACSRAKDCPMLKGGCDGE